MKIFILILTLISQNLAGNSSLGAPFALGGNFGEQQTQKSSFIPKISSKYKTSAANTRICDLDSANQAKIAESNKNSPSLAEGARGWVKTPSLRDSVKQNRGNPPIENIVELQSGLPREQSSLAMTENKDFAESSLDSAPSKQESNHNCKKNDITGFWLSPRDKVSARTSIIKIFKKDGKYFAYNVAFLDELPPKKDALNQNFALRDRDILGSVYAYNLERSGEESYINGRYYDFNKGKIFHLKAKLDCNKLILLISADNVGFLGKKKIYSALEKDEAEFYIKTRPTIDFSGVK